MSVNVVGDKTPRERLQSVVGCMGSPGEPLKGQGTLREDGLKEIFLEGVRREVLKVHT
jgi:hypothetical protein